MTGGLVYRNTRPGSGFRELNLQPGATANWHAWKHLRATLYIYLRTGLNNHPRHPPRVNDVAGLVLTMNPVYTHEFANTWNRHDMKGMHELDTEDVEWINVTGNYWRGKAAVFYKGHDTIHRTIFATTSMRVQQTAIRSIALNVARAVATMTFGPVITPTQDLDESRKKP